jgi:predicted MFS family arabinose efflux permease
MTVEQQTDSNVATSSPNRLGSPGVIWAMTAGTGTVIANLYYAQPLEAVLAEHFHTPATALGFIVTVLQVGYALGLALILPLGDLLDRRKLLAVLMSVVVLGTVAMALAPSLAIFGAAAALVGLTSVAVQIMVPFAAQMAPEGAEGKAVSTVISGLLLGILLSRTVAGIIASALGWQAVFLVGASATAIITLILWRALPTVPPSTSLSYGKLLGSVIQLVVSEPVLRQRMLYGGLTFAAFSAFWTSVTFLLSGQRYGWNSGQIGAFALLGVAGALMARVAGRLTDRGHGHVTTGVSLMIMAASFVLIAEGSTSLVALAIGAVLMDLGGQAVHICNQGRIYAIRADARSRLNTAYMVAYFVGGSLGSSSSVVIYKSFGWSGVCWLSGGLVTLAALAWLGLVVIERFATAQWALSASGGWSDDDDGNA